MAVDRRGGLFGVSEGVCAFLALFGVMEIDSFGNRLIVFFTALVMAVESFAIFLLGIRLKNSGRRDKKVLQEKRKSSPEKKEKKQGSDEQRLQGKKAEVEQKSDTAKGQKIDAERAAKQAEIKKITRIS